MKIHQSLRPNTFEEFVGQPKLKNTLKTMIQSSKIRKEILDHILFFGTPGTGKTTLATIIANELNSKIHYIQGPLLEKKSDILSIFANVEEGDIVFIDEIHSINKSVEELIYNAMEDFQIDLIIGVEGNSKPIRMKLKPFTLIGATTKINILSQPFKDRFGLKAHLKSYTTDDIYLILKNNEKILKTNIDDNDLKIIASYSKMTPRIANFLLKRVIDFATANNDGLINKKVILDTFRHLELYEYGLSAEHINYLKILDETFDCNNASIDSISGVLNCSKDIIINEIEPSLLDLKLVTIGPRGRKLTTLGIDYLLRNSKIIF